MNQLQLFQGEAVPKRKLTRKRVHTNRYAKEIANHRDRVRIMQTMRGPKLLSHAMSRVMPNVEALREAGVSVGQFSRLKWWGPDRDQLTGRKKVVKNFESGEPERKPDKYLFNSVRVDAVKHTAEVKTPELIFAGSALGLVSKNITALSERREASGKLPRIRTS